jgi:hypothetical protein
MKALGCVCKGIKLRIFGFAMEDNSVSKAVSDLLICDFQREKEYPSLEAYWCIAILRTAEQIRDSAGKPKKYQTQLSTPAPDLEM